MTTSSPHWSSSPYLQYQPSSPTHHGYSAPSKHTMSEYTWNAQNMNISGSRDMATHMRSPVRVQTEEWASEGHAMIPSLASMPLPRPSESPNLPTIQTQDILRSNSDSSTWGWDSRSPVHTHFQMPPSHRTSHRVTSPTDQLSRYNIQQR